MAQHRKQIQCDQCKNWFDMDTFDNLMDSRIEPYRVPPYWIAVYTRKQSKQACSKACAVMLLEDIQDG